MQALASGLYKIITARNQKRSTAVVTNVDFDKWGQYLPDGPLAMTFLGRLVERAIVLKVKGKSYRAYWPNRRRSTRRRVRSNRNDLPGLILCALLEAIELLAHSPLPEWTLFSLPSSTAIVKSWGRRNCTIQGRQCLYASNLLSWLAAVCLSGVVPTLGPASS